MTPKIRSLAVRAALLAGLLTLSGLGMYAAARRTAQLAPDAVPAAAQAMPPVIVLDAGHGAST